mgnify:CR=1 FL=1
MTKQQKEAMEQLNNLKTFGMQIREGRDKCGYSKSRLAEELTDRRHTVTEKDIARWERESRYPDIDLMYKIAEKLKEYRALLVKDEKSKEAIVQELKYVITKLGTENFIIYKNGNVEYKLQK